MIVASSKEREVFGRMDALLGARGYLCIAAGTGAVSYRRAPSMPECGCGAASSADYLEVRAARGPEAHSPDCPLGRAERAARTGAAITVTLFHTPANWDDPIKAVVSEVGHQSGNVAWNSKGLLILLDAAEEIMEVRADA